MDRREVAALIAYADRLDPTRAPADQAAAGERLAQWCDLLADVPPTAPHPDGRDWNAAHVVRHHIASSPYPIKPSDVSRPWHTFKADVLGRHTDPVPAVDPDDPAAYRAALHGTRHAIATGQIAPTMYRELTASGTPERDRADAARLAALGSYVPQHVRELLAPMRKTRNEREQLAATGRPDPLDVPCGWCKAETGEPCRDMRVNPKTAEVARHRRAKPHPSRLDAATTARNGAAA